MPVALVLGGDHPFSRSLIGVSTSRQVDSIYNMRVWDKAAATWLRLHVRRTHEKEERHKEMEDRRRAKKERSASYGRGGGEGGTVHQLCALQVHKGAPVHLRHTLRAPCRHTQGTWHPTVHPGGAI